MVASATSANDPMFRDHQTWLELRDINGAPICKLVHDRRLGMVLMPSIAVRPYSDEDIKWEHNPETDVYDYLIEASAQAPESTE